MILPAELIPKFNIICPTFGQECASVLLQRAFIVQNDREKVAEVVSQFSGASEPAAAELAERNLITSQNRAAVAEFIKRVARRLLFTSSGLAAGDLSRILGVNRTIAFHMAKGTRNLTPDQIKLLVERLFMAAHAHAA